MSALSLDTSAPLVLMQFMFSNPEVIPEMVRRREPETEAESQKRQRRPSKGLLVIEPCENISVGALASGLEAADYELVDALSQARQHPNKPNLYYMVRFVFARSEHAEVSEEFKSVRPIVRTELDDICELAFWRVRAFSNPFFMNGEEVDGFRSLSFNFEARIPRFLPTGQPVVARRKDADGKKFGDPVPLEPAHRLGVCDGVVALS